MMRFAPLTVLLFFFTDPLRAQGEPIAVRPRYVPPVMADSADSTDTTVVAPLPEPRPSCWRAHPAPTCPGYFLTDFGAEFPITSSRGADPAGVTRTDLPFRVTWTIGLMANSGRNAHGGSGGVAMEEHANVVPIVEYRYRRWLDRSATLDAGVGFRGASLVHPREGRVPARGVTLMAGYSPNRWIGATLRLDLVRGGGRTGRALMMGVQSTRVSEHMFRLVAIGLVEALFAAIGVDFEWEDEP